MSSTAPMPPASTRDASAPAPGPTPPPCLPLDGRDAAQPPPGRRRDARSGRTAHPSAGELVIDDPAGLAAVIPALLGFHPRDSLVLVSVGGSGGDGRIGLTLRADLPPRSAAPDEVDALSSSVVGTLLRDGPRAAAVLVFAPTAGADLPHRRLVDAVVEALAARGVGLLSAMWVQGTTAGASWACYTPCGCRGAVPDPDATALAAQAVFDGRVVHGSRDAVQRLLDPVDPAAVRRRERILLDADGTLDAPARGPQELLAVVDAAIADTAAGALVLDDDRVVELARALSSTPVRDGALLRCLGPAAAAAEQLWTALVREVPDPEAAEPAVLLAACALLRGDGALANMALERAERAWPGHRLTGLLRVVAESAVPPQRVRELLGQSLDGVPGPRRRVRRAGGGSARSPRHRRPSC